MQGGLGDEHIYSISIFFPRCPLPSSINFDYFIHNLMVKNGAQTKSFRNNPVDPIVLKCQEFNNTRTKKLQISAILNHFFS